MNTPAFAHRLTIAVFHSALLLGSCAHTGAGSQPETPAARADSVLAAVDDIVDARCDLEERCHNVGAGQTYDTRDTCESKMQGTSASEINAKDCPLGVDPKKLEACVASIRAEECGSVFDSLTRWNTCRPGQLCYSR